MCTLLVLRLEYEEEYKNTHRYIHIDAYILMMRDASFFSLFVRKLLCHVMFAGVVGCEKRHSPRDTLSGL